MQVPEPARSKRLFLGYNGTITIGILPVATFCSGHTYFVQRMPQRMTPPIEPFTGALHQPRLHADCMLIAC